jgi:hypothetical protein
MGNRIQVRLGLLRCHPWPKARDNAKKIRSAVRTTRVAPQRRWHRQFGFSKREDEAGREDAHHRVSGAIQRDLLPHDVPIGGEATIPKPVRQDGHASVLVFVMRRESAAEKSFSSDQLEKIARDARTFESLRCP